MASERAVQLESIRCECGAMMRFTATFSPWEFEGACETCHRAVVTSWAHVSPPPTFVRDGQPQQGSLLISPEENET